MIRTEKTVRMLQAVAAIAGLAILLWSFGLPTIRIADAANLTYVSNTLSTSAPTTASDHEIQFTIPTGSAGVEAGESIIVTFPNGFNVSTSGALIADYDLEVNGTDEAIAADGAALGADWGIATSGQTLTFTSGTDTIGAGATVTIKIGSNADGGTTRITNPTATGSYEFSITSGDGANNDDGVTQVVVIDQVTVTASVDAVFTFQVNGVSSGGTVNGTSITGNTSAIAIPFGTLAADTPTTSAQELLVTTNARYGYTVSVIPSTELVSATGADINGYQDGSYTDVPSSPWQAPAAEVGTTTSYGHWGITTDDYVTGADNEFSATDQWVSPSTTQARIVMGHTGPADGATPGIGSTTVGYRVEISSLQEAADDYETTLTYIATPVF